MSDTEKLGRRAAVLSSTVLLVFLGSRLLGMPLPEKTGRASGAEQHSASEYVGPETCKSCHEQVYKQWETTPHWKTTLESREGPSHQGCEACHGPGKAHADAMGEAAGDPAKIEAAKKLMFNFKGMPAADTSKRCLGCHVYDEEHSNFARQSHNINNVSCIDCHDVHHPKQRQYLLAKASQPLLCFSCHQDISVEFTKPYRHRVLEGLVKCTDCHNQHGGFLPNQLRATAGQDAVCFKCHIDKFGPFVHEHAPVKTEGCVVCHTPHGSTNPRLLRRSQINLLCLECHTLTIDSGAPGIPSFHNQSVKYQACTMCHTAIHGSNFDAFFFK